jgi:quinol-cytochrome oxidoreductase complex cytochrome b subunit
MDERKWIVATRVALVIVGLIVLVLVVTGVMLVFGYRPEVTTPFQSIPSHSQTRTVHRTASLLLFPGFACLVMAAAGLALVRHRAWRLVPVVIAGIAVVAASFTGRLLPWDQLNIAARTVGPNVDGYGTILFNSNVRYVLIGNSAVGPSTIARWFWMHVLGTTLLLVVPLAIVALQTRGTRRGQSDPPVASWDAALRTP